MKKNNNKQNYLILFTTIILSMGCSDQFLQDKKDYGSFDETIFDQISTATGYVNFIYDMALPTTGSEVGNINMSTGRSDAHSKSTEEFAGSTEYTKLAELLTSTSTIPDYMGSSGSGPWNVIRTCNMFFVHIDNGKISQEDKDILKGQVYFWRAWMYTKLVNTYGGVPIIKEPQNPILGSGGIDQSDLKVQRSSTAECIEFICEDLDNAIELLPGSWDDSNWGRITSGAAAAVKGRLLLTYASPLFNRNDETSRWKNAYDANKEAYDILIANGFGLVPGGNNRATQWGNMFVTRKSSEAVMVKLYNNRSSSDGLHENNGWEQSARPKDIQGGGSYAPTSEMVDLFPMADGKKPGESTYEYDELKFYKNRDPRFYQTFAFNGAVWPYKQNPEYTVWNYQWYRDEEAFNSGNAGLSAMYNGDVTSGIYLRKRTNKNADFIDGNQFKLSPTPFMELRFAEVVLNLAEAACGIDQKEEAYNLLKSIRERVGYTGDCGLDVSLKNNRDALFSAILYERQIELAYEGKRFQDMRRWMLWNDDFGTCTRLGVEPLNGKRRHGIFLAVKPSVYTSSGAGLDNDIFNPESKNYDPTKVTRLGIGLNPDSNDDEFNRQIEMLDRFYDENLERHENDLLDDTSNPRYEVNFRNKYYFLGFKESMLKQSPYLYQNVGWDDYYGNEGTFDPLK